MADSLSPGEPSRRVSFRRLAVKTHRGVTHLVYGIVAAKGIGVIRFQTAEGKQHTVVPRTNTERAAMR